MITKDALVCVGCFLMCSKVHIAPTVIITRNQVKLSSSRETQQRITKVGAIIAKELA
jgi:hypothetical protein